RKWAAKGEASPTGEPVCSRYVGKNGRRKGADAWPLAGMEGIVRDSNRLRTICTERPTGQHRLAPHPFSFPTSRGKVIVDLPPTAL
ncbi:MAG: hypothetical protein WBL39_16685, partial [Terrimicrobiaceae bacterium]